MALNAINGIASGVVANKKTPLVAQGLALLSFKLMKFFRIKVIGTINSWKLNNIKIIWQA